MTIYDRPVLQPAMCEEVPPGKKYVGAEPLSFFVSIELRMEGSLHCTHV